VIPSRPPVATTFVMNRTAPECSRPHVASIFDDLLDAMQAFTDAVQRMVAEVSARDVAILPEQNAVATAIPNIATALTARKQMDLIYSVTPKPKP
jgi:hypothetical protein